MSEVSEQLDRLSKQVAQHSQEGRFEQAIPPMRQIVELRRVALGEAHPDFATSLQYLAKLYWDMGDFAAALPLVRQALGICRVALGEAHPHFATTLNNLAMLYLGMGDHAAALSLFRQALEITRAALGEAHPHFAASLNSLAELYREMGNHAAALPLHRQALEIRRTALGEAHPDFAGSLNNLALLFHAMGDYAAALPLYRQALEIYRTALGEAHPDFAASLSCLAALYWTMGDHAAALPLHQQALEIKRTALGETRPDFATSLSSLAALYQAMGDHAAALPLCRQALDVHRAALGKDHPDFATSLNNLAALYQAMGDYAAALPLYRQALEVRRSTLGEAHPHFAHSLNNLALLYKAMGDHAAALPLYRQALEVGRTALGEAHPDFATSLNNLAALYQAMGDYAAALPLYRQALEVTHAALGEAHPDFAASLNGLAALYQAMGDYAAALPLYRQTLEVTRAALGEAHPDFATSLNNLAELYRDMGDDAAALPLHQQALGIKHMALGEDHPQFANSLNNLARLSVAQGHPFEALTLLEQATIVENRQITQIFSIGSERQRVAFLNTIYPTQNIFLSLVCQQFSGGQDAVGSALNVVLRRKALVAETLSAQRDAILGGRYPALRGRLRELTALRQQIARKTLAGPGPEGVRVHQQRINQWEGRKERLEGDLARHIPEMNLEQQLQAADRRAVALALPPGCTLIEFVRFRVFDFHAVRARGEPVWLPLRYLAFVLPAGDPDAVRMIDLGEAGPIDQLIAEFRDGVTDEAELRDLTNEPRRPTLPTGAGAGARLRAALFDPLTDALRDCQWLLLAPDGALNRLPLGVLPLADGRLLFDAYRIHYVSVGRDVMRFQARLGRNPMDPLVVADPDFDLGAETGAPAAQAPSRLSRDLDRSQCHFSRLPGTYAEGERVGQRLGVQPLLAGAALEGKLKACRSPRILHLATHGFFLPDQPRDLNQDFRNMELLGGQDAGFGRLAGPGMENPMLRSGLALAGVNTFLKGDPLPPDAEDGLLTAEDVAGLDLLDTELVVLSACETGLGMIHAGEGVFGLRRAFIVAGAKTLVMSLWKVPDLATAFLMDRFYDNLLTRGLDRDLALSDAQRFTRDATIGQLKQEWLTPQMIERFTAGDIEARRRLQELVAKPEHHRPFESPFFWGAFICQGDPSPLPSTKTAGEPEPQVGGSGFVNRMQKQQTRSATAEITGQTRSQRGNV